jgi:regulator of sigma E protease
VSQRAFTSKEAIADFLLLFALISMNVGIVNLLPIPALDGSRLLFLVIEKIIRRPFNKQIEAMVHMVGLVLLLSLIAFISLFDIWNWVHPLKGPH